VQQGIRTKVFAIAELPPNLLAHNIFSQRTLPFGGGAAAWIAKRWTQDASFGTQDLGNLVEKGALRKTGERMSTRYALAIPEFLLRRVIVTEDEKLAWVDA